MNKILYLILMEVFEIIDDFLNDKITGQEFIYRFQDWYYYNFKNLTPKNNIAKNLCGFVHDNSPEIIGYYEPCKAIREAEPYYWDDQKLKEELIKFQNGLKSHISYLTPSTWPIKSNINNSIKNHLEYMILSISKVFTGNLGAEELIKIIADIYHQLKAETKLEQEIKDCLERYFKLLQDAYKKRKKINWLKRKFPQFYVSIFPPKEDPLKERDPFWDVANELKKELYFYLHPVLKKNSL